MNEETKLLLMSYVDGELNEAESLVAEDIIKTDTGALDFVNKLKQANIQIDAFYEAQKNEEIENELYQFLEKDILKRKSPQSSFMEKIFNLRPILNYSLTALFFLSIGIFYPDYSNIEADIPYENSEFEKFTKDTIELDFFKTKSFTNSTSLKQSVDDILLESIIEIISKKSKLATITYGADIYRLELESKIVNKFGIECYAGKIFKDKKTEFIFCNNNSILSISYK